MTRLYISAHQDDDLIFMNPRLMRARHDPMIPSPLDTLYEEWLRRSYSKYVPPA